MRDFTKKMEIWKRWRKIGKKGLSKILSENAQKFGEMSKKEEKTFWKRLSNLIANL